MGNLDSFDQLVAIEFIECSAKYGRLPCQEQSRLIKDVCHLRNNESESDAINNCKIGKK